MIGTENITQLPKKRPGIITRHSYIKTDYKQKVIDLSWEYLYVNFRKFNRRNKIQVALAVAQKDMVSKLEHSGEINVNIPKEEIDYRVNRLKKYASTLSSRN